MSAWMVSADHIDLLLTAAIITAKQHRDVDLYWGSGVDRFPVDYTTADQVGALLLNENQLSVNHRYTESELEPIYTFKPVTGSDAGDLTLILKAIQCYEYQSCEHPGWKDSKAKRFCEALRNSMITLLPGYDEAQWGYER